jgi:predicted nucleic acid-binding protein
LSTESLGLLDTSVFIANESKRPLGELPTRAAVSVVTIAELRLGVLSAADDSVRSQRRDTLALAQTAEAIPVDEGVMLVWAQLVADCRSAGVQRVVKLTDALIAATGIHLELPVVTQDDDFDQMARAHPALRVLKV